MFNVGDAVVVKSGLQDVDFDIDIGGWQGRVEEIDSREREAVLLVHWDSVTLREMPDEMIEECEEQGLSWTRYPTPASDVEPARPRDTQEDVAQAVEELEQQHAWAWLGEQGRGIRRVLGGVDPDDRWACIKTWRDYLEDRIKLPFEAEVDEFQERGPLQSGDRVTVRRIITANEIHGIIVRVTQGCRQYDFPLCDLEALDIKSPNHQMIRDYRVWFANY